VVIILSFETSTFTCGRKAPDLACVRSLVFVELIDSPIIRFLDFKRPGAEGYNSSLRRPPRGISNSVKIVAEVHCMQYRTETGCPGQSRVFCVNKFAAVIGNRVIGLQGWNRKTPDLAFPRTVGVRIIDLIDSPIVGIAIDKAVRIRVCGKANNKIH